MAANPHYVVHCPPSIPDGRLDEAPMAPQGERHVSRTAVLVVAVIFGILAIIAAGVVSSVFVSRKFPEEDPVYSVAVAGVAGLDTVRDVSAGGRPAVSPVFNLTFHIDNSRNSRGSACVPGLVTAEVSYGDAFLAKGTVPPFCARKMHESEDMAARAWGQDVVLPPFLRDQLAGELGVGEAAVDVKVTMPARCHECSDKVLLCSKVKIGGGRSLCRLDYIYPRPLPTDAGSTG